MINHKKTVKYIINSLLLDLPPLNDGGIAFDQHQHGVDSLGFEPPPDTKDWVKNVSQATESSIVTQTDDCLPSINLLMANPLQRMVIAQSPSFVNVYP